MINSMSQMETLDRNLDIVDCVDRGFSKFGKSVGEVVFWKFQFTTKLSRNEVARRPDLLSKSIREIFKDGAPVIEKAIIKELRIKFQMTDRNYVNLEDAVQSIQAKSNS